MPVEVVNLWENPFQVSCCPSGRVLVGGGRNLCNLLPLAFDSCRCCCPLPGKSCRGPTSSAGHPMHYVAQAGERQFRQTFYQVSPISWVTKSILSKQDSCKIQTCSQLHTPMYSLNIIIRSQAHIHHVESVEQPFECNFFGHDKMK